MRCAEQPGRNGAAPNAGAVRFGDYFLKWRSWRTAPPNVSGNWTGFFSAPGTEELLELKRTIEELRNQHATARDETVRPVEQDEVTNHAVVAGRDRRDAGLLELAGTGPPPRRGESISAAIINIVSSLR
jgi:hypothetical protein